MRTICLTLFSLVHVDWPMFLTCFLLRFCNQMVPVALASMETCAQNYMGGFWKNFILVHVLVRSLCSALSALCTSILPGGRTVESRFQELSNQDSLQSICFGAKVSEQMMQWRGGFRMLFVVFHRFSQGFHGSRALKNTMNSSTFHLVEANITNFFGGCLAAKHKSF